MASAVEAKRFYKSRQWQALRARHLAKQPYCVMCAEIGTKTLAEVVDHKTPWKRDTRLALNPENLQSLCKLHHDSTKQRQDKSGILSGTRVSGMPLDPNHPWNLPA
jgi:5-methylcytosine-specific restriction protein A